MNWDDAEVFCRVVEAGGFTAAARRLARPKSSVSAAVLRLEAALGARLLERTTRRLRLTEAGESFHHGVAPLLAQLREVAAGASPGADAVAGLLRVAAPYEFGAHHLGAIACDLMARHPQLAIQIDVEHASVNLFERHYDIVFSMVDRELAASSIVARRVFTLERGVFAAPALVERLGAPSEPAELARLPLLAGATDADWAFAAPDGATAQVPIAAPRLRSANAGVRLQAALAGLGAARITASYCAPAVRDGRLRALLPDWRCAPLKVYALLPTRRLMPARVRAFLEALDALSPSR